MAFYEYLVVPAPRQGQKIRGVKGKEMRFAHALSDIINAQAAEGWEYLRAESLPVDQRSGMFSARTETMQCLLVFRRELSADMTGHDDALPIAEQAATPEELARDLAQSSEQPSGLAAIRKSLGRVPGLGGGGLGRARGRGRGNDRAVPSLSRDPD